VESNHGESTGKLRPSILDLPQEQQAIRAKCFHLSNSFIPFKKDDIEQSIPNRFEQRVKKHPDRIAIKSKNHALTYDDVNKTSNRIARAILEQRGSGEEPIALLLENDAAMIATMLGALKAGKTYVPLDPSFPIARTTYILQDLHAGIVVTNNKNLSLARKLTNKAPHLLNIDDVDAGVPTENLSLSISPDTSAFILYTSGSTGNPKGVIQNHRNVLHDIMQYTNTLHICPEDRMTLLYSCSVNGAMRGVFGALLNGAALYPLEIREEGLANLANLLIQEEITFYHSVATVFRNFISTLTGKEKFPRLRLIRFGGERVLARDVELYKKHFHDDCILYTGMGATETGHVCQYFIDKQSQITGSVVPTGYPIEDKEVLLLDDAGEKIGLNRVGEIAVKSRYLSLGYWRKSDVTPVVFLPDREDEHKRIYRTGDLGRLRPDGCLIHMGRKDFQVKIRGYRVEVAEIEAALLALDSVNAAIVQSQADDAGEQHLVAYLVPTKGNTPTVSDLRQAMVQALPVYMVPSAFVFLDTLPLTPNGKVDRTALPGPGGVRPELDTPYAPPGTWVEEELAKIWAEVLALDRVGIHDNFFDLGGHSLAATRVVSQVIKRFRLEIPLRSLFEAPTVAEMAVVIIERHRVRFGEQELESIITEIESLSEEEAQRLLADKGIGDKRT
jgi:amino acid adenylation domain-containing protein